MRNISTKRKLKEGRGTGTGADYKPWILAREFGSIGTESVFNDWKHGRPIQCLSQAEKKVYMVMRFRDDVIDIREQYPLDISITRFIARKYDMPHPCDAHTYMTTDFLVTHKNADGSQFLKAYSVKPNENAVKNYMTNNIFIEQMYWAIKGIHLHLIYSDMLDKFYVENIRQCIPYYSPSSVHTKVDFVRHLISRKVLPIDMHIPLNYPTLVETYLGSPEQVQYYLALMQQTYNLSNEKERRKTLDKLSHPRWLYPYFTTV